jgi:hypothetical protein
MGGQEMSAERRMAVEAMQSMGWQASREPGGKWVFRRPDTGGMWDLIRVQQQNLSPAWVCEKAMLYGDAPDLAETLAASRDRWFRMRFPRIATTPTGAGRDE